VEATFDGMASRMRDRAEIPFGLIVFRGLWFSSAMPALHSKTQRYTVTAKTMSWGQG